MTTVRARIVLPISSPPLENGMVRVQNGQIIFVGPWDGSAAHDLGDVILMPGLINAHCHLDYTTMRGSILSNSSFSLWVRQINELKRTFSDEDYLRSISMGFEELRSNGTTSVLNIESFPELMLQMPCPPLRTWWFYEMMDVRNHLYSEDLVIRARNFFKNQPCWLGGFGLSPHAPYTTSLELYRFARSCCEKYVAPLMTHLAESDEEFSMFRNANGALYGFLKNLGRDMSDTGVHTPVAHLLKENLLPDGALLTHMNLLEEKDWEMLHGHRFSIIHCPRCHEYFERPPFPLERFLREGFNVCLGTDSLASNNALNMFSEMQSVRMRHPSLADAALLDLVTRNAARAIGMSGKLGEFIQGAEADMIALPYSGKLKRAVNAVIEHTGPVAWTMVAGQNAIFFTDIK